MTNKGEPMKTLPEILDNFINRIEWAVSVPGAIPVDRYKEGVALEEAVQAIAKELMGCLPEKMTEEKGYHGYAERFAHNQALDEVRARLTAFIGREK